VSGLQLLANSALNLPKAGRSATAGSRLPLEMESGGKYFSYVSTSESGNRTPVAAPGQLRGATLALLSANCAETSKDLSVLPTTIEVGAISSQG
jgi:hypothetical protein